MTPKTTAEIRRELAESGWREELLPPGFPLMIGPIWSRIEGGGVRHGFIVEPKHLNSRNGAHGGMLMAFADHVLGLQVAREVDGASRITVQFNTQFVAGALVGEFVETHVRTVRHTRSLLFMQGSLRVGEREIVAIQCIFKIGAASPGAS